MIFHHWWTTSPRQWVLRVGVNAETGLNAWVNDRYWATYAATVLGRNESGVIAANAISYSAMPLEFDMDQSAGSIPLRISAFVIGADDVSRKPM
jgi:hypothetical protein